MNLNLIETKFPLLIIDDFYNADEQQLIWTELNFLQHNLKSPDETGTATAPGGKNLKSNKGVFLDDLYFDRKYSIILSVNRKLYNDEVIGQIKKIDHWWFNNMNFNRDSTLISYYENDDSYLTHRDDVVVTGLTWFYRDPKSFTGGNLSFPDYNVEIECINNRVVLFPGCVKHSVSKVSIDSCNQGKGLGRWCMSQFGNYI